MEIYLICIVIGLVPGLFLGFNMGGVAGEVETGQDARCAYRGGGPDDEGTPR